LVLLPFPGFTLEAARRLSSQFPVAGGGGPAGSEVLEATIRSMAERLGAMLLGDIGRKRFMKIFLRIPASSARP